MIEKMTENLNNNFQNNTKDLTPNFGNKNEVSGGNNRDLTPNFGNKNEISGRNNRDLTPKFENVNDNIIENKAEGLRRENEVENELKEKYPENKGLGPLTDMNEYLTKDENSPYVNDITHKTDDNGNVYCEDGKLKPNNTYILNGYKYTTDDKGRIISVESKPTINPENTRNNSEQTQVGGKDRRPNDQGGHIIGRDMNGDGGIGNLLPMDGIINQSDYKRMENEVKKKLENGENVTVNTKVIYNGDSSRPDKIITTIEVDGKKDTVWKFDNNIDGSLMKEVPENGKDVVQDKVDETGGEISSIKEKYDEKGNLLETTVYITYKDENGNNHKASVIIEDK